MSREIACLLSVLFACAGVAQAQLVPAPPAPTTQAAPVGVLLLLSEPRTVAAESLRQTLERAFKLKLAAKPPADGRGNWLQVSADGAAIRVAGVLMRLTASAARWEMVGAPRTDADDADALRAVKEHKGFLLLEAAERPTERAQRAMVLQAVCKAAAALVGPDCMAIALLEHGSFRSIDAQVAIDLTGADPQRAFAPLTVAGAMVLLRSPRVLDAAAMRRAANKAFGVEFPERSEDPEADFVLVRDDRAVVRHAGNGYVLQVIGEPVLGSDAVEGANPTVLAAVREHKAALRIGSALRVLDAAEVTAHYARLGRLLAELLGDDALALNFLSDPSLHVLDASAAEKLRSNDPPAAFRAGVK